MPIKKSTKTHTSSRQKASTPSSTKRRTKKTTTKVLKRAGKSEFEPNISEADWVKLRKRTLKMFQMVYDSYQRGEFDRIF